MPRLSGSVVVVTRRRRGRHVVAGVRGARRAHLGHRRIALGGGDAAVVVGIGGGEVLERGGFELGAGQRAVAVGVGHPAHAAHHAHAAHAMSAHAVTAALAGMVAALAAAGGELGLRQATALVGVELGEPVATLLGALVGVGFAALGPLGLALGAHRVELGLGDLAVAVLVEAG